MKWVRERQIPYDFTYMWNLKNKKQQQQQMEQTEQNGNGHIDTENKQVVPRGFGGGGMSEIDEGD